MQGKRVLGHKLRLLRQSAGWRTGDLATAVGHGEGYIRNIEGGSDQPGGLLAFALARALSEALGRDVTLDEFSEDDNKQAKAA